MEQAEAAENTRYIAHSIWRRLGAHRALRFPSSNKWDEQISRRQAVIIYSKISNSPSRHTYHVTFFLINKPVRACVVSVTIASSPPP